MATKPRHQYDCTAAWAAYSGENWLFLHFETTQDIDLSVRLDRQLLKALQADIESALADED